MEVEEFDRLLSDKRHKELIGILTKMLKKLSDTDTQPDVVVDTSKIEAALKTLNKNSQQDLPGSIKSLAKVIGDKIDAIKFPQPPKEWNFDIKRDAKGLIKTVNAKSK